MPSIGQAIIQGLATGFQGNVLATNLARQDVALAGEKRQEKQAEYQASADKVWSKAIMDVLAGSQAPSQPLAAMPQAPAPGQASVPMAQPQTQGPGGVAARPVAPGTQAPAPQVQPAGGVASPTSATLATLGQTAVPQSQPPPIADPMNAANILAKIKADNPNLDPGVLSSVVNDHLMPYLTDQQKNSYKQFEQHLEIAKLGAAEQDKANTLYFRYQQLQEQMDNAGANRELRAGLAQQSNDIKQQLVDMRQPEIDTKIQLMEAQKEKARAQLGNVVRLPPALQARLKDLTDRRKNLEQQIRNVRTATMGTSEGDAQIKLYQDQITPLQEEIDGLLDKADTLADQGAPQQPQPTKGSGEPDKAGQPVQTVPNDKPPQGMTPERWATYTPAQKKIMRDFEEGRITQDEASAQLAKTQ